MQPDQASEPSDAAVARYPRLIHVERDRHVRSLVALFAGRAGFEVEIAETGYLALDRVRRLGNALVLTEILIPELDGLALCRLLKGDAQVHAGVVVLSMLSAADRARVAGADAFLDKPVEEYRLVTTLQNVAAQLVREGSRA